MLIIYAVCLKCNDNNQNTCGLNGDTVVILRQHSVCYYQIFTECFIRQNPECAVHLVNICL